MFIAHYPTAIKAFYMEPDPQRPEVVLAADLIAPEGYGEICGGTQRIHDLALLEQRIERARPAARSLSSGISTCAATARVPHSGFGMGIER